jgi:hypothetical protein
MVPDTLKMRVGVVGHWPGRMPRAGVGAGLASGGWESKGPGFGGWGETRLEAEETAENREETQCACALWWWRGACTCATPRVFAQAPHCGAAALAPSLAISPHQPPAPGPPGPRHTPSTGPAPAHPSPLHGADCERQPDGPPEWPKSQYPPDTSRPKWAVCQQSVQTTPGSRRPGSKQ